MTIDQQNEWLALLEAERARRNARVEWEAGEPERAKERVLAMLEAMAQRAAVAALRYPLQVDDMSPAEKLACHLLPEDMQPAGLPSEDEIWAEYRARKSLPLA